MDKVLFIILIIVAAYILFWALKSAIGIIFKIAIIALVLSFLGYNVLTYQSAIMPAISETQDFNETAYYAGENITASNLTIGNATITSEQNITEEKNTTET